MLFAGTRGHIRRLKATESPSSVGSLAVGTSQQQVDSERSAKVSLSSPGSFESFTDRECHLPSLSVCLVSLRTTCSDLTFPASSTSYKILANKSSKSLKLNSSYHLISYKEGEQKGDNVRRLAGRRLSAREARRSLTLFQPTNRLRPIYYYHYYYLLS